MGQSQNFEKLITDRTKGKWSSICNENENVGQIVEYMVHCSALSNIVYNVTSKETCHKELTSFAHQNTWFCPKEFSLSSHEIQQNGPFYIVVEFELFRIVVVRGTQKASDWLTGNIDIGEQTFGQNLTRLHQGFCRFAKDIPSKVIYAWNGDDVIVKQKRQKTLIFTGHSLGGAVAEIAALPLLADNSIPENKIFVFTFGAPSIVKGNQEWHNLHRKKLQQVFRFYWEDDCVSVATHLLGYIPIERLIKINSEGIRKTDTLESKYLGSDLNQIKSMVSNVSLFDVAYANHDIIRYFARLTVTAEDFIKPLPKNQNFTLPTKDTIKSLITTPSEVLVGLRHHDNATLLVIQGSGVFLSVCRAVLVNMDPFSHEVKTIPAATCDYTIESKEIEKTKMEQTECKFTCEFDVTNATINQGSLITQTDSGGLFLRLCTGFDAIEASLPQIKGFKNVALLGITGSGKTHLAQALAHHANGAKQIEVFNVGYEKAPDDQACSFISGDKRVYELPGVDVTNQKFLSTLQELFSTENYPPSLIIVTFKKGQKDAGGLRESILKLRQNNMALKILLVLTRCPPESWTKEEIDALKISLHLNDTEHMSVNSAKERFMNTDILPSGLPELWNRITQILTDTPIPPSVKVLTVWELLVSNASKYITMGMLVFAAVAVKFLRKG